MSKYQGIKTIVQEYFDAMERATPETVVDVLDEFTGPDYLWRGVLVQMMLPMQWVHQ